MYPVALDLAGRLVVVVGGGTVATRRAKALIDAGADVHVVAPSVTGELAGLAASGTVTLHPRAYAPGDLAGAWLVHAATDDAGVNAEVAADAEALRIWCVRADDASASSARTPAVARSGEITVAVTSGDPARSRELAARLRSPRTPARSRCAGDAGAASGWSASSAAVRATRGSSPCGAGVRSPRRTSSSSTSSPRATLLDELDADVLVVDAGKAPHAHNLTQDQINATIVEHALAGRRVVRLKGGDPYVFGRGGEEALACVAAGVPFEVVPGVTSAVAVPALAGIPVTHRGVTQDVAIVSAHLDPSHPGATVDWDALAHGPGTLVLLMAVAHLDRVAEELVKRGRSAATPVAVISDGTTPRQRVLVSTLAEVAADVDAAEVRPPAVVVVGDVVRLRELLAV